MNKIQNRLVGLFRELDVELDGVLVPSSAAAIINAIRLLLAETLDSNETPQGIELCEDCTRRILEAAQEAMTLRDGRLDRSP